jgi:hypothetical protein
VSLLDPGVDVFGFKPWHGCASRSLLPQFRLRTMRSVSLALLIREINLRAINVFFCRRIDLLSYSRNGISGIKYVLLNATLTYPELPGNNGMIYVDIPGPIMNNRS